MFVPPRGEPPPTPPFVNDNLGGPAAANLPAAIERVGLHVDDVADVGEPAVAEGAGARAEDSFAIHLDPLSLE